MRREEVDDPVDGLLGVGGVQSRHHEVTGFRSGERRLDGFGVAHLTDQDDVGVLTHGGAQCCRPVGSVGAEFTLVDDGHLVVMDDFDRVLDRQDVNGTGLVDRVDHRGEGRGLAGARGAGDQHQTARFQRQRADHRREAEGLQGLGLLAH